MEYPIRVVVIVIMCLIAALIIAMLLGAFGSQTNNIMGGFFDFFKNILGFGKK
jgi:hypothetical protein